MSISLKNRIEAPAPAVRALITSDNMVHLVANAGANGIKVRELENSEQLRDVHPYDSGDYLYFHSQANRAGFVEKVGVKVVRRHWLTTETLTLQRIPRFSNAMDVHLSYDKTVSDSGHSSTHVTKGKEAIPAAKQMLGEMRLMPQRVRRARS